MFHVQDEDEFAGMSHEELLHLGAERFNAGQYFEAHEAWEAVWLEAEREMRNFYQGLIQVAAAFVHLQRNEYPGTVRLLDEGLRKLRSYPPETLGVQLAPLIAQARTVQQRVIEVGEHRLREIDLRALPQIEFATN
jgi:predicted metal-dependent hydrolase